MEKRRTPPNLPIGASDVQIKVESNKNRHFDAMNDGDIGNTSQLLKSADRGRATTLPAWMTSQEEVSQHSPFITEPVQPSQHPLTSQPPLPPGPAPVPKNAPLLPPPPTPPQASRATRRGTRGGRHRRRANNDVAQPPFTTQPSTPYNTTASASGLETPIFHPGAGFEASGTVQNCQFNAAYQPHSLMQMVPLPFSPVCFLQPSVYAPPTSLCNRGSYYIPVESKVYVFTTNHSFAWRK